MNRRKGCDKRCLTFVWAVTIALGASLPGIMPCAAQSVEAQPPAGAAAAAAATTNGVTINVQGGTLGQALVAFQRQTGRSIVMGPTVTNVTINVSLIDQPWDVALDVMLKPYGYGYKLVGDTVVVNKAGELDAFETLEPLVTEVFSLTYLEASDVLEIIQKQLSADRGSVSVLISQPEKGWEFDAAGGRAGGAGRGELSMGKRQRLGAAERTQKSKTLIVKDTPAVIESIRNILAAVDRMPAQILIESRFIEVGSDFLQDIGLEWGTGATGAESPGVQTLGRRDSKNVFGIGAQQTGGGVVPAAFTPASGSSLSATEPFNAGLAFKFQQLTGTQFELLMHALQEDSNMRILSAPRVLTLNNQEATINVGTKFPIIRSDISGTTSGAISTSLEYYENIGIQLNVVPQVCGSNYVSLIVHPAVTDQIGTEGGVVVSAGGSTEVPLTKYPVLSTREAETQIIVKSGTTIVIGGLLKNRDADTVLKVPVLGDIPLLGSLFRRTTRDGEQMDLLIFLTATIASAGESAGAELKAVDKAQQEARTQAEAAAVERLAEERAAEREQAAAAMAELRKQAEVERKARVAAEEKGRAAAEARDEAERRAAEVARAAKAEAGRRAQAEAKAEAERMARERAARETERLRAAAEKKSRAEAAEKIAAERRAEAARKLEQRRLAAERKAKAELALLDRTRGQDMMPSVITEDPGVGTNADAAE